MTNPNPNARRNIKPGLSVPAGLDPELEKFLRAVKEHLQGNDGTKGQPLERFVTLEDLKRIGLIDTMVKGGRGEIKTLRAAAGTDLTSAAAGSLSNLSDISAGGALDGAVLRWRAALGKWRTGPLLDSDGIVRLLYLPYDEFTAVLDVFTTTDQGVVPPPGVLTGAFLMDDGTWVVPPGGGSGALVYSNTSVPGGNTVANTNTETAITSSYNIPATALGEGTVVRLHLAGVISSDGAVAPDIRIRAKLDGQTVLDTAAVTIATGLSNAGWQLDGTMLAFTIGATGTIDTQGVATIAGVDVQMPRTSTLTVDTTQVLTLTVTLQWDDADTDNTVTVREMLVFIDGIEVPTSTATFLTENDETAILPGSRQLLAGDNIDFDDSTPGQRTVSGSPDVSAAQAWTADASTDQFPDGQMVVEGLNIELDYTVDNEVTIDVLPVHQKGAAWSNKAGTAIVTGDAVEVTIQIPWNCVIREVSITTYGGAGSCVIDIEKGTYSGFPTTASICGSSKPTISSSTKYNDTALSGWTTAITAGDVLRFQLESSSTFSQISIVLKLKETN